MAERKRQLVAGELAEAALQLLARKGFDTVTVDEIAAAAGVSKRTFFRYFASKEDVVVRFLTDLGLGMRAELADRPAQEPPAAALLRTARAAMAACADRSGRSDHAARTLRVVQLILRTPPLLARFLERQEQWRRDLAEELALRQGLDADADLYPELAAGMALTAFNTALRRWSDSDGTEDAERLLDRAFAVVAPALDAAVTPAPDTPVAPHPLDSD